MANAGVCSIQRWDEVTPELWDTVVGINLTGVWNTCVASIPHLLEAGRRVDDPGQLDRRAEGPALPHALRGVQARLVGIMRSLANELAAKHIRVNSLHPTGVDTPMLDGHGRA